jgi:hypothetical protein
MKSMQGFIAGEVEGVGHGGRQFKNGAIAKKSA